MRQTDIAARLVLIEESLLRLERALALRVPPEDVRAHFVAQSAAVEQIGVLADAAPELRERMDSILTWLRARMAGDQLQAEFDDLSFVVRQLIGILQGSRDDIVQLRGDQRRLAALLEHLLRAQDDRGWKVGDAERRKASGF